MLADKSVPPARIVFGGRLPGAEAARMANEARTEYHLTRLPARAVLKQGFRYDFDLIGFSLKAGITVSVHIIGEDLRGMFERLPADRRAGAADNLLAFIEAEQTPIGTTRGISGSIKAIANEARGNIKIGLELWPQGRGRSGEVQTYKLGVATEHTHLGGGVSGWVRLGGPGFPHGFMPSAFEVGKLPAAHLEAVLSAAEK